LCVGCTWAAELAGLHGAFARLHGHGRDGPVCAASNRNFQPMNCSFGLIDSCLWTRSIGRSRKAQRYEAVSARSLAFMKDWAAKAQDSDENS
jgi:folate-dependent tRNA-U54 methylase TrmFO/GidA